MYASSIMEILRVVPREEIFKMIMSSYSERAKRYASLIKLTPDEKKEILTKYPELKSTVDYYQGEEFILGRKSGK